MGTEIIIVEIRAAIDSMITGRRGRGGKRVNSRIILQCMLYSTGINDGQAHRRILYTIWMLQRPSIGGQALVAIHSPEISRKLLHRAQSLHKVLESQLLLATNGQRRCRPCRVLDLPTVDIALGKGLQHVFSELAATNVDSHFLQERAPDLHLRVLGELLEVQSHMYTRQEGLIERLDSVRGQEEDAAIVFDVP